MDEKSEGEKRHKFPVIKAVSRGDVGHSTGSKASDIVITLYGDRWPLDLLWWSLHLYTHVESLCCTPTADVILYVSYTSVGKN